MAGVRYGAAMSRDARTVRSRRLVGEAVARLPQPTRGEIARTTGLSGSTVASVVRELVAEGRLAELAPEVAGARGRPVTRLVLADVPGAVLGIDLGHRHASAAVGTVAEELLVERRVENDGTAGADELIATAVSLVEQALASSGVDRSLVRRCVVALPAPIDPRSGRVHDAPIVVPAWRGRYPAEELSRALGLPVSAVNDANAGAVGERSYGVGGSVDDLVYLNATLGVGAGLVLGGRVYTGPDGAAGEIGHIRLPEASGLCRCAQYGCLESVASIRALSPKLAAVGVETADLAGYEDLRRHADHPAVRRLLAEAGRGLGNVLADICNLLSPSMVIIGGELAAGGEIVRESIRDSLDRHALSTVARSVRLEFSRLGASATLRGAVALAAHEVRADSAV